MDAVRPEGRPARAVVFAKKSTYDVFKKQAPKSRVAELIDRHDPAVARIVEAHEAHRATVEHARDVLSRLGVEARFVQRDEPVRTDSADLVITLGGDGTLLTASHSVGARVPVLAINSAPNMSVGYFAGGDRDAFEDCVTRALAGTLPASKLARMAVELDGRPLSNRVLNDALFCHPCPAATSRYSIRLGEREEDQRSSGLWVGPAAGSTAAQRSAGGQVLPLDSEQIQFVVREPYIPAATVCELVRGCLDREHALHVRSKMPHGVVYLDGPQSSHVVELGGTLTFRLSNEPLTILGLRDRVRGS